MIREISDNKYNAENYSYEVTRNMEILYIGLIVTLIGGVGTLIAAFKTSVWWGLGCLLLSPVSLVFLVMHWKVAKNPFFLQLIGLVIVLIGSNMA